MKDATATVILYASIVHTSSVVVIATCEKRRSQVLDKIREDIRRALGNEATRQIPPSLPYLHRDNLLQLLHIYRLQVYGAAQLHKAETLS